MLTVKILEELRMFTNFKIDSQCPMNLILMGQPELNKIIRLNSMKALYQRINCRSHITGLTDD
jgi:general secretion pathway protein A